MGGLGALKYLQEKQKLKHIQIKNYIGTSVGAIISVLLYVGFSLDEIEQIFLDEFNLNKIFNSDSMFSSLSNAYNLLFKWGLYSSDRFENWFDKIIQKKQTNLI